MYLMSELNEVGSESVTAIQNHSPSRKITEEFCHLRCFIFLRQPINKYFSVDPLSSLLRVVPENYAFFSKYWCEGMPSLQDQEPAGFVRG